MWNTAGYYAPIAPIDGCCPCLICGASASWYLLANPAVEVCTAHMRKGENELLGLSRCVHCGITKDVGYDPSSHIDICVNCLFPLQTCEGGRL